MRYLSIQNITVRQLPSLSVSFLLKVWGPWDFYKYTAQEAVLELASLQMQSHFYLIYIFFTTWVSSPHFFPSECYLDG